MLGLCLSMLEKIERQKGRLILFIRYVYLEKIRRYQPIIQSHHFRRSTWDWLCKSKNVMNLALGIGLEGGATFYIYLKKKIMLIIDIIKN